MSKNYLKQKKATRSEKIFQKFCVEKKIDCKRLDEPHTLFLRKQILKDPAGKCPDFICLKGSEKIFVEVKTLTNFTNAAREKRIEQKIVEAFDLIPELKGPLRNFLKDASNKFKNIKEECDCPGVMYLDGVFGAPETIPVVYAGVCHTYVKVGGELKYVGRTKTQRSLFDERGSHVSAIVWYNDEKKRFECLENSKARVKLTEGIFSFFFG